jgi:hypothetical protein
VGEGEHNVELTEQVKGRVAEGGQPAGRLYVQPAWPGIEGGDRRS